MFVCVCVCMCWGVFNVTKFTCFTQGPCVAWGAHTDEVVHALHTLGSVEAWITLALVNVCHQHTDHPTNETHTHTHTRTHTPQSTYCQRGEASRVHTGREGGREGGREEKLEEGNRERRL